MNRTENETEPVEDDQSSDVSMEDDSGQLVSGSIPTPAVQTFHDQRNEP